MEQATNITNNLVDFSSISIKKHPQNQPPCLLPHYDQNSLNIITPPSTPERNHQSNYLNSKGKTHELPCFALNLLQNSGAIQVKYKEGNFYLLKLQMIEIADNYKEKFEIGKKLLGNYNIQEKGSIPDMNFWYQRYYYYSLFDKGIQMDYESWYSVTPEPIAKYIATLAKDKIIIDGFCGSGGNVIQFSKLGKKVYAIEIDDKKLQICRNNCKVYSCENNIEFILGDFLTMKSKIKADYVFLSPPWGGLKYKNTDVYSIKKLMIPDIYDIIRVSLSLAPKIFFYVPRNLDLDELFAIVTDIQNEISISSGRELFFDIRILKSNKKVKALLIVFGEDESDCITENDLIEYIRSRYDFVTSDNIKCLLNIVRTVGYRKFFKKENEYLRGYYFGRHLSFLLRYFMIYVLTQNEQLMLTGKMILNMQKPKQRTKLEIFKNNEMIKPFFPKSLSYKYTNDK